MHSPPRRRCSDDGSGGDSGNGGYGRRSPGNLAARVVLSHPRPGRCKRAPARPVLRPLQLSREPCKGQADSPLWRRREILTARAPLDSVLLKQTAATSSAVAIPSYRSKRQEGRVCWEHETRQHSGPAPASPLPRAVCVSSSHAFAYADASYIMYHYWPHRARTISLANDRGYHSGSHHHTDRNTS